MKYWHYAAIQYLNKPYKWAGNGPWEFDCSGFVLRVLRDVGLEYPDMTAGDLYKTLWEDARKQKEYAQDGSIIFYGSSVQEIDHCALVMESQPSPPFGPPEKFIVEAGGAGSETQNMSQGELLEYCKKHDARVRIKPLDFRPRDQIVAILDVL